MVGNMRVCSFFLGLWAFALSGCGTINENRESYMKDSVYEKERYLGDAVSDPKFLRYELRGNYVVSEGDLDIYVDPVEVYAQEKEQFVVRKQVSYKRYGPYRYSPARCLFGTLTVFPALFATFDDGLKKDFKKTCYKVYEWEREEKELPAELAGTKTVELVKRNYTDSQGALYFQLFADGRSVDRRRLTGFKGGNRNGAYVWKVNNWFDFSRLGVDSTLKVELKNNRKSKLLRKSMTLTSEEAEALVFKGQYDGVVQYYYVCTKCNADLKKNYYSDTQRIVWYSGKYKYKADSGMAIHHVATCLDERFDTTGSNGHVKTRYSSTPAESKNWHLLYQAYGRVRPTKRIRDPNLSDLRACARSKGVNVTFDD